MRRPRCDLGGEEVLVIRSRIMSKSISHDGNLTRFKKLNFEDV